MQVFNQSAGIITSVVSSAPLTIAKDPPSIQRKKVKEIVDESGDLDEMKCLQLLMTPQVSNVQLGGNGPVKAYVFLKPSDTYFSELTESYILKVVQCGEGRETLCEVKLHSIESILMKNIVQRQFVLNWNNGGSKVLIEAVDKSDHLFQALNFIYQKNSIRRI